MKKCVCRPPSLFTIRVAVPPTPNPSPASTLRGRELEELPGLRSTNGKTSNGSLQLVLKSKFSFSSWTLDETVCSEPALWSIIQTPAGVWTQTEICFILQIKPHHEPVISQLELFLLLFSFALFIFVVISCFIFVLLGWIEISDLSCTYTLPYELYKQKCILFHCFIMRNIVHIFLYILSLFLNKNVYCLFWFVRTLTCDARICITESQNKRVCLFVRVCGHTVFL